MQFHTIAIIAEGIPENKTKKLIKIANEKNVTIIGPATVSLHTTPQILSVSYCTCRGQNNFSICMDTCPPITGIDWSSSDHVQTYTQYMSLRIYIDLLDLVM